MLNLGNYCVLSQFSSDVEREEAEALIPQLSGPSFAEIEARLKGSTQSPFPRHQVFNRIKSPYLLRI